MLRFVWNGSIRISKIEWIDEIGNCIREILSSRGFRWEEDGGKRHKTKFEF